MHPSQAALAPQKRQPRDRREGGEFAKAAWHYCSGTTAGTGTVGATPLPLLPPHLLCPMPHLTKKK